MKINKVFLAALLARENLTSKALAEKAGISRVTVSAVKCGKTCAWDTANAIAKALNVDIADIVEQEN